MQINSEKVNIVKIKVDNKNYEFEISQNKIYRYLSDSAYFSPGSLKFSLCENGSGVRTKIKKEEWSLGIFLINPTDGTETLEISSVFTAGDDYTWEFDINNFLRKENPTEAENTVISLLRGDVVDDIGLCFNVYLAGSLLTTGYVDASYGTTRGLASFTTTADSINAAVRDTKLVFNENGLTVKNGSFEIIKEIGENFESLLYADENGDLVIKGLVYAAGGRFTGEIRANSGSLGNLDIDGRLNIGTAEGGLEIDREAGIRSKNGNFSLGLDGLLRTKNMELGGAAILSDQLVIGSTNSGVVLYNPDLYNDKVLECGANLLITKNGEIQAGRITIDGVNSAIFSDSWRITPEKAIFNNAEISGTLKTAVFDKATTRLSGGSIIFKDSELISEVEKTAQGVKIYVDGTPKGQAGEYIYLTESEQICSILEVGENYLLVEDRDNLDFNKSFIYLGSQSNGNFRDWVIGINSNDTPGKLGIKSKAITLNRASYNNNTFSIIPQIVLGDLTDIISTDGTEISGLYASSVYLTGSLTTKFSTEAGAIKYAGVNTLNGAIFNKNSIGLAEDRSNIIFWAGSEGTSADAIQNAKFQVTANGTLYASQGYFSGSILTDANIKAGQIYAADLYPVEDEAALKIHDTKKGIQFCDDTLEKELLTLSTDGFKYKDKRFILFNDDIINLDINTLNTKEFFVSNDNYRLGATTNSLGVSLVNESISGEAATGLYQLDFLRDQIIFKNSSKTLESHSSTTTSFYTNEVSIMNDLRMGDKVNFQKTAGGYDVYIEE